MKRIIYIVLALLSCLTFSCKKDIINVQDFGKVVIDSISPGSGPSGSNLAVYGKNFAYLPQDVKVKINGVEGQVVESTLSRMVIFIPQGATTGKLHFTFNRKNPTTGEFDYSGQVQSDAEGPEFTINESLVPMPIIKSVNPRNGKAGDKIIIKGFNFSAAGNCRVLFGDISGETVIINQSELQVKVPVVAPGTVALKVQQGNHQISAGDFIVDETPKGVKEIYFVQGNGVNQICKAVFDDLGNPTITILYDRSDGIINLELGIKADIANGAIYWTDGPRIVKGSTDGSLAPVTVYTDAVAVADLDIAAGKLYFTSLSSSVNGRHSIKRINTDGSGTPEELYLLPGDPTPFGLKVNAVSGKLYWAELSTASVYEGSINGQATQPAKVLFDGTDGIGAPINIAISPSTSKIFIIDLGNTGLWSAALDGTGALTSLPVPAIEFGSPSDIEIDDANQFIYWLNTSDKSTIMRCKFDAANLQQVVNNIKYGYFFDLVF